MPIYEFEGNRPVIDNEAYIHPEAVIIGRVTIGQHCFIGAGAVLRADFGRISIGQGSNVQENAVIHASPIQPVNVAEDVIIAHGALIHDSMVGKGAVIGMGAILLHNVVVEEEAFVGAGAVVASGFCVPSRKIVVGNPAHVIKDVSEEMLSVTKLGIAAYQELPSRYRDGLKRMD